MTTDTVSSGHVSGVGIAVWFMTSITRRGRGKVIEGDHILPLGGAVKSGVTIDTIPGRIGRVRGNGTLITMAAIAGDR